MLIVFSVIFAVFALIFGFVVLFGAPYLPSLKPQYKNALKMVNLKPGQTIVDLGCGDGRVLNEAARLGLFGVGYEINPMLVVIAKLNTFKHRKFIKIIWGNYWTKKWPKTDGIFVFLLDKYMSKLDKKINEYQYKPVVLASFAFKIPNKKPAKTSNGVYLYKYN